MKNNEEVVQYKHLQMNSDETIRSFSETLYNFIRGTVYEKREIVIDGASCHTSKATRTWMNESGLRFVEFGGHPTNVLGGYPPNSPDLNPIENTFAIWSKNVYKREYHSIEEFIEVIEDEWNKIPQVSIKNCIDRLHKVVNFVVSHEGEYFC